MTHQAAAALASRSLAVIRSGQARTGAYVASPTFPVYRYCWFRDGAFIADAASRAGDIGGAEAFFGWCSRVLVARRDRIQMLLALRDQGRLRGSEDGLPTRYSVDGEEVEASWWNFQLDGYGTWLWALAEHVRRHGRDPRPYAAGVALSARYVAGLWDLPCYDWWEEFPEHVHTSTLGAIAAGLRGALELGVLNGEAPSIEVAASEVVRSILDHGTHQGRLAKWLGGTGLDASLISLLTPFRLLPARGGIAAATVAAIERDLAHGGVHRYAGDTFYGGGEWVLLAGMLGWHYAASGREDDARRQLEWIVAQADPDLLLPEQTETHLLAPDHLRPWIERWGPSARPLLWSHAMFLDLALESGAVPAPMAGD